MTNGIQEAVLGLLKSGMQRQARDGDTLGIWTYDDQLHTGFPMLVWSNQNQSAIIQTVSNYLTEARYQTRPRLEKVLPAARRLVEQSRVITLIFVFDGSETLEGTGFDQDINDLHQEFGRQMRADNIPFVTALAARDGKVFDYRVRTPSSASLPPTADFFAPAETNTVPVAAAATNLPPPAVVAPQPPPPPEPRRREVVLRPPPPPETNPPPAVVSIPARPVAPEKTPPVIQPAPPPVQPALVPLQTPSTVAAPASEPSNPQSAPSSEALAKEEIPPPVAPPPMPPPVPATVAMPSPTERLALLAVAISLVAVAVALVLILMRRPRAAPSIISQSMDRPK
jgi:hypothetical protein